MTPGRPIYLDHHATTPCDPRVAAAMQPYWSEEFGNPASASHAYGWRAEAAVEQAREAIARAIGGLDPREIVFTSGATESDNLALQGALRARGGAGAHVVTVATEHPAVLDTARALAKQGASLSVLPVDAEGRVDPADVARAITRETLLVSVMAANGEIGTLAPLAEIAAVCAERGVLLHSDAAQALGKIPVDVEALGVDLLSISGHKLYGPKGIGALYVRRRRRSGERIALAPLLHGGGQERGLRSGTLPTPLIVGLARAISLAVTEQPAESARLARLRDRLLARLRERAGAVLLNGAASARLAGNLNVALEGISADAVIARLPDLALSTGSACSSAKPEPSHVLAALGLPPERIQASLRIGLGRFTTEAEVERAAERVAEEVRKLRAERAGGVAAHGADR
ncbi:MAG: cysteine desulfurase family protein [Myxococcota bacterium]